MKKRKNIEISAVVIIGTLTISFLILSPIMPGIFAEADESWVPYIPSETAITIEQRSGNQSIYTDVCIQFSVPCYNVTWGMVTRIGNTFYVDTQILRWTGVCIQIYPAPFCHTYDLGVLQEGNYTFVFKAWDTLIKTANFDIGPIDVYTDKELYILGETVNSGIKNTMDKSAECGGGPCMSLEKKVNEQWKQIKGPLCTFCIICPGDTCEFPWILDDSYSSGEYRVNGSFDAMDTRHQGYAYFNVTESSGYAKIQGIVNGYPNFGEWVGTAGANIVIDTIIYDSGGNLEIGDTVTVTWPLIYPPAFDSVDIGERIKVCGEYKDIKVAPESWSNLGEYWILRNLCNITSSICVVPTSLTIMPGEDFCIDIRVNSSGQAIRTVGFQLTYPTSFTIESFTYENLLSTSVLQMGEPSPGDNSGFINYAVARIDDDADPVNGKLVTICFTAPINDLGIHIFDLHDVVLIDESGNPLTDIAVIDGTAMMTGPETFVEVNPSFQVVKEGENFAINITIRPGEPIAGAQVDIHFDPNLLTATSVTDGDLFDMWMSSQLEIDNVHGEIRNIIAFETAGNVFTEGVFATLHFTAKASYPGESPINLTNVILGNPEGETVWGVFLFPGYVTIEPPGDIEPPMSSVNMITPYKFHLKKMPLNITADASDDGSGIREVFLYYRYSDDNITWTEWILYGENQAASPYIWLFTAPNGTGYYEFYSQAQDNADNLEAQPINADSIIRIYPNWDVNMDETANILDIVLIGQHWGETGEPCWIPMDVNSDGIVNILDLILVANHWTV